MDRDVPRERLRRQIDFVLEIDKLKHVFRQTDLLDESRKENDAEHSWHLAVMAILLSEYALDRGVNLLRVLKMVLVHDVVEIDAGDTYRYDTAGYKTKAKRECADADRLFSILPPDQAAEMRALWDEFEAMESPEARFAAALDRLQPLLHNYHTHGAAWREHGVTAPQVLAGNRQIAQGSPRLWAHAERLILDARDRGDLA